MKVTLTNTLNQSLFFKVRGNLQSASPVFLGYNQSHEFIIPNDGSTTLVTEYAQQDLDWGDDDQETITWRGPSYSGTSPPFIAGGTVTAVYAGNNYSTTWTVNS